MATSTLIPAPRRVNRRPHPSCRPGTPEPTTEPDDGYWWECAHCGMLWPDGEVYYSAAAGFPMCPQCSSRVAWVPSPEAIRRECAEIRAGWDDVELWARHHGCTRPQALERMTSAGGLPEYTSRRDLGGLPVFTRVG